MSIRLHDDGFGDIGLAARLRGSVGRSHAGARRSISIGLTARMLLIVGVVASITAIAALTLFAIARSDDLRKRQSEQAELLAGSSAALLRDYIVRMNTSQITPILRSIAMTPPVTCASLALEGLPQRFGSPVNDCEENRHPGALVTSAVEQNGRRIGTLALRLSDSLAERDLMASVMRETAVLATLMAAAATILALALRYVVTEPIKRLAAAMRVLSGGSVAFEVPDRNRRDELGEVARALDVFRETKIKADRTARELLDAQAELIEQAKFASLGAMVAGVAHEVNTPLGVCVTAISAISDSIRSVQQDFEAGKLTQQQLRDHLTRSLTTSELSLANLDRAARLIRSFKAVAADQATEAPRQINLAEYLEEVIAALQPETKKHKIKPILECPKDIVVYTQPAALWQIISNLVMNSMTHGFQNRDAGTIRISAKLEAGDTSVSLTYEDDGVGMSGDVAAKIFEPFFTTKRAQGGTGLGMTIVYNLVTQALQGRIRCESEPGAGARFILTFPRTLSEPEKN